MAEQELFEALRDVLVERMKVDAEKITLGSNFFDDLGLDSIDLTTAVMAIEEKFGIEVSDKELEQVSTIGQAVEVLSGKVAARA
jgi:acyl carrier protein